jgi:polyhydroxyalkanoate synthase
VAVNPGPISGLGRELQRGALRVRNGVRHLAGAEWAPIGPTPSDVVWRGGPVELRHYRRAQAASQGPPVIAIGGLVGRAYIFDLTAGNSFVARVMDAGFEVFVLDWGVPTAQDAASTLETYLLGYLRQAIRAALLETGAEQVNVIGYCMGGTLALHGLAAQPELPVRNLVVMATPVDFGELSPLVDALADGRLEPDWLLDDSGNVPPELLERFFTIQKPTADLVQLVNLWQHLWSEEFLETYQALSRCFDQVPLPGRVFAEIARQWVRENAFINGRLRLRGRPVSLAALTLPMLVVSATRDELVPRASSAPLIELLTGTEAEPMVLEAGHASLTSGRTAARVTVPQIMRWLAAHSDAVA